MGFCCCSLLTFVFLLIPRSIPVLIRGAPMCLMLKRVNKSMCSPGHHTLSGCPAKNCSERETDRDRDWERQTDKERTTKQNGKESKHHLFACNTWKCLPPPPPPPPPPPHPPHNFTPTSLVVNSQNDYFQMGTDQTSLPYVMGGRGGGIKCPQNVVRVRDNRSLVKLTGSD